MNETGDFGEELERELHRVLDPIAAQSIPARRVSNTGGLMKRILGGAGAALAVKFATGFAIAALAATAAGAATEIAITGSVNPNDWGQQVKQAVSDCKDTLRASGTRGIGKCVSAFAKQHGKIVSDEHRASKARENPGHGNGNGNGNGNDKDKNKDHGQPGHKPTPTPKPESGFRTGLLPTFEG